MMLQPLTPDALFTAVMAAAVSAFLALARRALNTLEQKIDHNARRVESLQTALAQYADRLAQSGFDRRDELDRLRREQQDRLDAALERLDDRINDLHHLIVKHGASSK
ncbi:MAG: hypothetical protein HY804_00200 [Nitrospinae bacterium]|nr:hypothetical protein [Nitrospinota bacterium]